MTSTDLIFCISEEGKVHSARELGQALHSELGRSCCVELADDEQQLVIDELGIIISLVYDEDGELIGGVSGLPIGIETENVVRLCKAFKTLGWDF